MAFKSSEFAWKDLKVVVAGKEVAGIKEIEYETQRETVHIYAAGDEPHSKVKKEKHYTGRIVLFQSELEALTDSAKLAGGEDVTDISFDVIANYSKSVTSRAVTDSLVECDITRIPKRFRQGDDNMEIELPIMIGKIKYGVG